MPNRLLHETSPYLLQHAHNPVDWYPWGKEALQRAKAEAKPIFLSIGYSACHWCHVMERESFENEKLAEILNRSYICIKVDREERPELDQIYMTAVQMLTGRGGWPMSVFLTPDGQPFFGGTYWPPHAQRGMPGFDDVLRAVSEAWSQRRGEAQAQAEQLTARILEVTSSIRDATEELNDTTILQAARVLERSFDSAHGGFGGAPKFPHPTDLQVLLRAWHRSRHDYWLQMVRVTLDKMAHGGIYDHLGGGFARYSVDERWLVPHFEKMLYDNALLGSVYLDAYTATGNDSYAEVARQTLEYVLRDMTHEEGGFCSSEDADSEGEEGKFYLWELAEVRELLGPERADQFCYVYDVSDVGNFEGRSILNLPKTISQCAALRGWDGDSLTTQLRESRATLLAARNRRVRPGKDDKVLVSWNALMIDTMSRAGAILEDDRFLNAARRAVEFILREMVDDQNRLWHTWRGGRAHLMAYLDDYAYLANALITLYESSFDEKWIDAAMRLIQTMRQHYADPNAAGLYYTADDHELLIARQKDFTDSPLPSSNGMAATALSRLGRLCGRTDFLYQAREIVGEGSGIIQRSPTAAGQLLIAHDLLSGPCPEMVFVGDPLESSTLAVLREVRQAYIPNRVVALRSNPAPESGSEDLDPLFQGKQPGLVSPTLYVCEKFVCSTPVSGKSAGIKVVQDLARNDGRRDGLQDTRTK